MEWIVCHSCDGSERSTRRYKLGRSWTLGYKWHSSCRSCPTTPAHGHTDESVGFGSLDDIKSELRAAFEPPQSKFRMRTEFLNLCQGYVDIHDYVQKAWYLVLCVVTALIEIATQVNAFMIGLLDGPVKTYQFHEYPDTLERAFSIALREDFSAKQARAHSHHARF